MPGSYLKGACIWKGAEIAQSRRWVKEIPAAVLEQIDSALERVKDLEWRHVDGRNFPLPDAAPFFDDVREELENGSGMVRLRGLQVGRYDPEQLRRLWYGLGHHLGTPMFQNCRGEVMREIRDEGMNRLLMRLWLSMPNSRALPEDHAVLWGDVAAGKPHGGIAQPATAP